MMEESLAPQERSDSKTSSHIVHALMQFALAVTQRKNVVLLCVFVALALGALYYATATRYYAAKAELFVIASGDDARSTGLAGQGRDGVNLMPTYERLITSSTVVENAIEALRDEERVDLADVPRSKWVAAIQQKLSAKSVYGTNNIEIEYLARDPAAAVAVVNQVVQAYLAFMDVVHKGTAEDLIQSLQEQQTEITRQLQEWRLLLAQRRRECGDLVGTDADSKYMHPLVERHLSIEKERVETTIERVDATAKLRNLERAVANGEDLQAHIMAVEESAGRELMMAELGLGARDAAKIAELEKQRINDRGELDALLNHLGYAHPDVQLAASRIREVEQAIAGHQQDVRRRMSLMQGSDFGQWLIQIMRKKTEEVAEREKLLAEEEQIAYNQAAEIDGQLIEIKGIESQIEWGNQLRDRLLDKIASLSGAEDGPIIRAEVVSEPVRAVNPASPNLRRVGLLALLAGLGLGLASVYVLDTLDDRFRSVEELQRQVGVPVMAIVQELPPCQFEGIESLQMVREPDSPESEAFRTLRTSLVLTHDQSGRIVVTSAEPGDGKTTVLANMAVAYANSGKRTLLIDADLRRPGLTAMLGLRGVDGLSAVIRSPEPIGQIVEHHIEPTTVQGLDVLPSGPRPMNPAELLGGQSFADLLAWAETRYDRILIDSPPALAASDTAIIGQLVDGVLLVVQPLKNQRRMVLRAVETFAMLKIPLVGVVANRVGKVGPSSYYGYSVDYSADVGADFDEMEYEDELDCPPESSSRIGGARHQDRDGGIDLSQLGEPRRRGAA